MSKALPAALAAAAGGTPPVRGRVIDEIGDPVVGVSVRALSIGGFEGHELGTATTDAGGGFTLHGLGEDGFAIVVETGDAKARIVLAAPRADVGEILLVRPLRLTASIGDGGDNRPRDLSRLQNRLHRLGRLTPADVAAEPINLAAAPPVVPGPRLLAALADHLAARSGRRPPHLRVDPGTPFEDALAELPPFPTTTLALAEPVGALPGSDVPVGNSPPAFARVQHRLRQLGLLRPADHAAEAVDPAAVGAIDPATRPRTIAAIATFEREIAGTALRAIVPATAGARLLDDPACYGRPAVTLRGSVGTDARNLPDDVRQVQDRLLLLGHLAVADRAAERPAADTTAAVPATALPLTIAALRDLRETRLGEAAPAIGFIDQVDPALRRLEEPAPLVLTALVMPSPVLAANRSNDVRRLQDRLLWLGLLSLADHAAEKTDPDKTDRIELLALPRTILALAAATPLCLPLALTAPVGRGATNLVVDVRAVQDRCRGLGSISAPDFEREKVDPAAGGTGVDAALGATFTAIETLRQRLLGLPPPQPDAPWTAQALVAPGDETEALLRNPVFFGRGPLRLTASVGTAGWNFPADVRAVQDRLRQLRLLSTTDHTAEKAEPRQVARLSDGALPATCTAIARLRRSLLGVAGPLVERIELRSEALVALDDRLGALHSRLQLTGTVGWGGANDRDEVLRVLERLHGVGFLSDDDHALDAAAARALPDRGIVRDGDIAAGIDAIGRWQQLVMDSADAPLLAPLTPSVFALEWPPRPRPVDVALAASVGQGGVNGSADVREVQDRLFELGVLPADGYLTERVDPAAVGAVPSAALPATIAAIRLFQQTAAGSAVAAPDSRISPTGLTWRVLQDPTYGTPTRPNPACALGVAGPARPVFALAPLRRIALAIEQGEGGVGSGEIPALLRNASGTPASFGRAQVIGGTGLEMLTTHADLAAQYGLDPPRLAALVSVSTSTGALVDDIRAQVAGGWSEATLRARIAAYALAHGAAVRTNCGLGLDDIARIFRAMQFRLQVVAIPVADAIDVLFNAATHPAAAANLAVLGFSLTDVTAYHANSLRHGEHRAGFVTRALFSAVDGQALRNALTDDSGSRLGRIVIESNWNSTAGLGLGERDRAMLTAFLHNNGGYTPAYLAAHWATVTGNAYTQAVIGRYDIIP